MSYPIEDLDLKDATEAEYIRSRTIFDALKVKAINNEEMTEHEKDFFSQHIIIAKNKDGKLDDYSCCSNFKFEMLYLTYHFDLSGRGSYNKLKDVDLYQPNQTEIKNDIDYLSKVSGEWIQVVNKTNHSEKLLQEVAAETRKELSELEKNKGKLIFSRDRQKYIVDKRKILLHSKYLYNRCLRIFEKFDKSEFVLKLNGKEIEIEEYGIVHIFNRHFSRIMKVHTDKSFHNENFDPSLLNKQLGKIFSDIDNSGEFKEQSIDQIAFKYNGTIYQAWIYPRTKQIKGKGNVSFNRLETFYPVENQTELKNLSDNFELKEINETLSVYVKK